MKNSTTHHHLCAVINTEVQKKSQSIQSANDKLINNEIPRIIRILDMGCGNGKLMVFLYHKLPQLLGKSIEIELYGFDVSDSNIQYSDFFEKTIGDLTSQIPSINWEERVFQITSTQTWPFPDNYFDYVISNQVMEHVIDYNFVFQQIRRTLKQEGMSIHLFPLKNYIYEGHILIPFVHRISNIERLKLYIKICSFLRFGWYKQEKHSGLSINDFSEMRADYIAFETNYLTKQELINLVKFNRLKFSFKYTEQYYWNKIRSILGYPCNYKYKTKNFILDSLLFSICVRVSCITLVLEKNNIWERSTQR